MLPTSFSLPPTPFTPAGLEIREGTFFWSDPPAKAKEGPPGKRRVAREQRASHNYLLVYLPRVSARLYPRLFVPKPPACPSHAHLPTQLHARAAGKKGGRKGKKGGKGEAKPVAGAANGAAAGAAPAQAVAVQLAGMKEEGSDARVTATRIDGDDPADSAREGSPSDSAAPSPPPEAAKEVEAKEGSTKDAAWWLRDIDLQVGPGLSFPQHSKQEY